MRGFLSGAMVGIVLSGVGLAAGSYFGGTIRFEPSSDVAPDFASPELAPAVETAGDSAPTPAPDAGPPDGEAQSADPPESDPVAADVPPPPTDTAAPDPDAETSNGDTAGADVDMATADEDLADSDAPDAAMPDPDSSLPDNAAPVSTAAEPDPDLAAADPAPDLAGVPETDVPSAGTEADTAPDPLVPPTAEDTALAVPPAEDPVIETTQTPPPRALNPDELPMPVADTTAPDPVGVPAPDPETAAPGVLVDRLPRIETDAEPAPALAPSPAPEDETPVAEAPVPDTVPGPAIRAFGIEFELVPGTPVMSIVLFDPGASRPDPAALADFPIPLSFGIDPLAPDAAEAMAAYRAAGHEVLVLTPIGEGATPADVEQSFQVYLAAVPEAIAVMDVPEARLQENRPLATQVADILSEVGLGLLTYERGLNSGLQVAQGAGVPSSTVFREFDDGIQQVPAMKRLLDVGAFRASQQGTVVLTGEYRTETVTALTEWALSSRAASVTVAPLSALLLSLQ